MKAFLTFQLCFIFLTRLVYGQAVVNDRTRIFQQVPFFGQLSTEVLDIAEDSVGYIWFASKSGVLRWDGGAMKSFHLTENHDDEIVTAVAVDFSGNIWASSFSGLFILKKGNDQFVEIDLADNQVSMVHQNIKAIRCGPDGNVWADTGDGFLLCIQPETLTFQSFRHQKPEIEGEYFYHNISFDADGNVWLKGRNLFITKFEVKAQTFVVYPHPRADDGCVLTVNGQTWYGAFPFDRVKQKFELNPKVTISNRVHSMCADRNGLIWLGGSETGLYAFDPKSTEVSHFAHDALDGFSLGSNTINKLFCDREGNIWIATDKGVCMLPWYYKFVEYYRGTQGSGFAESTIQCTIERKNGEWWFGTEANGVLCYNPKTRQSSYLNYQLLKPSIGKPTFEKEREVLKRYVELGMVQLPHENQDNITLLDWIKAKFPENSEGNVTSLFEDRSGNVWIGLYNHVGFNRYSDTVGFKRFGLFYQPDLFYNQPLWGANWYMDFAEDKRGNFWVATWEGFGLNLFDRSTGQFEGKHFMPIDKPYDGRILHHAILNDSLALIGGFRYLGLYNFRRNTFRHLKTDQFQGNKHWQDLLKYDSSSKVTHTQVPPWVCNVGGIQKIGDKIWFVTDGGIGKIDCKNLTFETVDFGDKVRFSPKYVGSLAASEKKLWFTNGYGLFYYDIDYKIVTDYSSHLRKVFTKFDFMNIRKLFIINSTSLLVGTSSETYVFDIANQEFRKIGTGLTSEAEVVNIVKYHNEILVCCVGHTYIYKNDQLEDAATYLGHLKFFDGKTIYRFVENTDKKEWFATDYGLFYVQQNEEKQLVKPFATPTGAKNIDDVFFLKDQRMILSFEGKLYSIGAGENRIENLLEFGADRLSNRLLSRLFVDSNDHLWVGNTENGVDVVKMPSEKVLHFSSKKKIDGSEVKCRINGFCETGEGQIWVASSLGLLHFENYKVADTIKLPRQIANTEILSVQPDQKGNLWMGTASGLWVYSPAKKSLFSFSQFYGLGTIEIGKAHVAISDGRLLFSSGKQVLVIDPQILECNISSPKIVPEAIKINGSNQLIKLHPDGKVKLGYKQNSLSVQFSLIGFHQTKSQKIAFCVTNESRDWQYIEASERQIRFESLQPGTYGIQLQPVDNQLQPIGNIALLKLEIVPPFWKRGWVLGSVAAILLIGTILLFWFRNRMAKIREQRMQQVIDAQTADLRSTAQSLRILLKDREKFMSIVSHDLKNPVKGIERITSTLNRTWQNLDEVGRTRLFDELHKTSSGASKLLDRLLMWSVQKQGLNQPGWEEVLLSSIISEVILEVERSASWKQIELKPLVDGQLMIRTDREMMSFVLRNLITNAIKYSHKGSVIEISAKGFHGNVSIAVADHGIGMSQSVIENLFKPGSTIRQVGTDNEKGTGLALIIVKEFIDRLGYSIQVESEEGKGATFTILIPCTNGK